MKKELLGLIICSLLIFTAVLPSAGIVINGKNKLEYTQIILDDISYSLDRECGCELEEIKLFKEEDQQTMIKSNYTLEIPSHNYQYSDLNPLTASGFTHTIKEIATPFVIANKIGEWIYFVITCQTAGSTPRKVYIQVWLEGELFDDWESPNTIDPGIEGRNTYPLKIKKERAGNTLDFKVETGHIWWGIRIKDDEEDFSIPIGKTGATIDQMSTLIQSAYIEMPIELSPHFQEITVGKRGQLHSIDIKPPLSFPGQDPWGCGPGCELNVLVVEWFDNWTDIPWSRDNFTNYILGEDTVSWSCSYFPLPEWREADFSNQNIFFNKGDKFILMLEGKIFSNNCGNPGAKCLGFSSGPPDNYPNNKGRVGFWNGLSTNTWMTWPTGVFDLNFRIWVKVPEDNNQPNKPNTPHGETNGNIGIEYSYVSNTTDPDRDNLSYLFDWDDGTNSGWIGPFQSGDDVVINHTWSKSGTYNICVKAKDIYDVESEWSEPLSVTMPMNQQSSNSLFLRFLERFPRLFPILRNLLGL